MRRRRGSRLRALLRFGRGHRGLENFEGQLLVVLAQLFRPFAMPGLVQLGDEMLQAFAGLPKRIRLAQNSQNSQNSITLTSVFDLLACILCNFVPPQGIFLLADARRFFEHIPVAFVPGDGLYNLVDLPSFFRASQIVVIISDHCLDWMAQFVGEEVLCME